MARVPIHGTRVSRTYEAHDPELRKKRIRPFKLNELEHIPRGEANLYRALLRTMPDVLFDPSFRRQVIKQIQRYAQMDIDLWFHTARVIETNRIRSLIPGVACIVVVGLAPRAEKILVEVDLQFVYRIVGKLLGAKGAIDIHRPLTEIEQGVFLFVALKVLALFQSGWAHPEQVALRIEDIRGDVKSTADIIKHEKRWLCFSWKLTFDLDVGGVRVLVPESLATAIVLTPPPRGSDLEKREHRLIRKRFPIVSGTMAEGWIEVGRIELSRSDLEGVDPGDIILLDEAKVAFAEGAVQGPAEMRIGTGRHGFLKGEIREQDGQQVFEVQEIVIEEIPDAHDPVEGHGAEENPEQVVAEYEDGEQDDGKASSSAVRDDDAFDEDYGIDDEDDGDDEEYAEDEEQEGYGEDGEEAQEEEQEEEPPADDNLEQAAPLLGDIPMILVVELGRVQLSADEVIRLRPGQLIELGRSPVDPVDLVVNGKLVAKGELVEIEGSLGVKLLNLVKASE
jgi:type III secretion system YscQ/HrcQ family protein